MNRPLLRVLAATVLSLVTAVGAIVLGTDLTGDGRASADPDLTVVGLGDSVMAGTACGCQGIAAQYAAAWGRRLHRTVHAVNLGVSGDTTSLLGDRLTSAPSVRAALRGADVVLVIEGANDLVPQLETWRASTCPASCYRPAVAAMGHRLQQALASVRTLAPPTAQVVVAGYWNVFADGDTARADGGQALIDWSRSITHDANDAIAAASSSEHAAYVDLTPAFDADGDGDPTSLLAEDGDHPNSAGVTRIVGSLLSVTGLPSR